MVPTAEEDDGPAPPERRSPRGRNRRTPLVAGIAALVVLTLIGIVLVVDRDEAPDPPGAESPPPTVEPESGTAQFALPDDAAPVSFALDLEEGQSILLELSTSATFEASTGARRALYTIFGMSCGSVEGPTNTQSVSGTENLLHQETRQISQLISYQAESTGLHRCNARVNAPNWDPDYGDAELTLSSTIRPVAGDADSHHAVTADAERPIVVEAGDSEVVIDETFPLDPGPTGAVGVLSSSHLTACTIENGSRDQTEENLCTEDLIDREGSTVITQTVVEQLDEDTVCRTVTTDRSVTSINHLRHHHLLDSSARIDGFTTMPCGDRVRVQHLVANEGPAALVVHRSSTRAAFIAY